MEQRKRILFDLGKTESKVEGQKAIAQIAEALKTVNDRTEIVLVPKLEGVLPALDGKAVSMTQ